MSTQPVVKLRLGTKEPILTINPKTINELRSQCLMKSAKKVKDFYYINSKNEKVYLSTDEDLTTLWKEAKTGEIIINASSDEETLQRGPNMKFDLKNWLEFSKSKAPVCSEELSSAMEDPDNFPCEECFGAGKLNRKECGNCYGTGTRPFKSMWKLIINLIDYKLHTHYYNQISSFLEMWKRAETQMNPEQSSANQLLKQTNNSSSLDKSVMLDSFRNMQQLSVNSRLSQEKRNDEGLRNRSDSKSAERISASQKQSSQTQHLQQMNNELKQKLDNSTQIKTTPANLVVSNMLTHQKQNLGNSGIFHSSYTEKSFTGENTYQNKKIEFEWANDSTDVLVVASNPVLNIRVKNLNNFPWKWFLTLKLTGKITKEINLNKVIAPNDILNYPIENLTEQCDGIVILQIGGKDSDTMTKYYSEKKDIKVKFVGN